MLLAAEGPWRLGDMDGQQGVSRLTPAELAADPNVRETSDG
jgi:hypothetical protein